MGEVLQHHGIAAELIAEGQVFQELGDGLDPVHGGVVEDVEGGLGVDEQRGDGAVVAGQGHVTVHNWHSVKWLRPPLNRRQTNGWQLYAGWRTGNRVNRQTRGSPAHSR